jgi:hypothetical protein
MPTLRFHPHNIDIIVGAASAANDAPVKERQIRPRKTQTTRKKLHLKILRCLRFSRLLLFWFFRASFAAKAAPTEIEKIVLV